MGNAYDLWGYATTGDLYNVRLAAYTGYWPFGFYLTPWPLMALMGMTQSALLFSNFTPFACFNGGVRCWQSGMDVLYCLLYSVCAQLFLVV